MAMEGCWISKKTDSEQIFNLIHTVWRPPIGTYLFYRFQSDRRSIIVFFLSKSNNIFRSEHGIDYVPITSVRTSIRV